MAFIAWPTAGFYSDVKRARTLNVLADILQLRLTDEIREKQGTTYSPSAGHSASETYADYGYLSASIQAPPDKLAGFLRDAEKSRAHFAIRSSPPTSSTARASPRSPASRVRAARRTAGGWAIWLTSRPIRASPPRFAARSPTMKASLQPICKRPHARSSLMPGTGSWWSFPKPNRFRRSRPARPRRDSARRDRPRGRPRRG